MPTSETAHPFLAAPHRTVLTLSVPVLISLIAEPLTGLVDTAFVARLGSVSLSALGVGTMALSSIFWIFNFLGIGSQTEISQSQGRGEIDAAQRISSLAILLGIIFGLGLVAIGFGAAPTAARLMGADGPIHDQAVLYMQIRLLGAPAVLTTVSAFGALRGLMDMRTPLRIAISLNLMNIALDALLIFGWGPVPAMGVAGAAAASAASQWFGALWAIAAVYRRLGMARQIRLREIKKLLIVGSELFMRTGLLILFLILATRAATKIGPDAGAAHQAIRQVWVFTNFILDALAITAQSLVGFFVGAQRIAQARRVATVVCAWSMGLGIALTLAMWGGRHLVAAIFVPQSALALFMPAWLTAAAIQPVSALCFATDGIHWGAGDFRFLRNAVALSTASGAAALAWIDMSAESALTQIWLVVAGWIVIRALFGMLRIWPGIGQAPLRC